MCWIGLSSISHVSLHIPSCVLSGKCCLQESVDALINCVVQNLGFSQGKPVAAFTIYRCLLNWKSFESEKTNVFDRLIQMIGSAIEVTYCLLSFVILCWIIGGKNRTNGFLV